MKRQIIGLVLAALAQLMFCMLSARGDYEFIMPQRLTDASENYQLSRCANGQLGFDTSGTLHMTYWSGGASASEADPSYVYYRSMDANGELSVAESIAGSGGGTYIGGRQPSLALDADGGVWIVWHDHRHTSSATGDNNINNIEIYADHKPAGGSFLADDLRLTNSSASHSGDNGYAPRIVAHPSGALSVAWYDFNFSATGEVSDLCLKTGMAADGFDLSETMSEMRLTNFNDRDGDPSYTVPDLCVTPDGSRHLVWGSDFLAGGDLYYGVATSGSMTLSETVLATGAWDFFDPAHIAAAPNGDVWIAYGDQTANGGAAENVVLLRKRAGEASFDPPVTLFAASARQYAPDIEIDADGIAHVVWIDRRDGRDVYYARLDTATNEILSARALTTYDGNWERPSIALDAAGSPAVLYEENIDLDHGDIWLVRVKASVQMTGADSRLWECYE
ncbi:hypothetical protein JXA32_15390 [Candidatus Sumerlaeota bacterium]|nr:hypothetical protein [Candidatus Sumerlaeota bacterium]